MKTTILTMAIALIISLSGQAQQATQTTTTPLPAALKSLTPDLRTGFQFSLRGGYDFPTYPAKELAEYYNSRVFKAKGGPMGGVSVDYYWDWFGVGVDGDYIRNTLTHPFDPPLNHKADVEKAKMPITRLFAGAGPNLRYLDPSCSFSAELNTRAGIGSIKGEDLTRFTAFNASGFFSIKIQPRFTYFVNPWLGFHAGAYYMHYFKVPYKPYLYDETHPGEDVPKVNISSIGTFAGVTFRISLPPAVAKPPKQERAPENFVINGKVVICETTTPIEGVTIVVKEKRNGQEKILTSNSKGEFSFEVMPNSELTIYGRKANYFSQVVTIGAQDIKRYRNVILEICMERADCDESVRLNNIHYDLDKYDIRPDARPELDRLVQFLRDNPEVRVELSSHTDSRASHEYNERLSQNRANSARTYIISKGIAADRVISVGYGETRLLNRCADGVPCSEAEHQLNRRTEMKVICPK